MSPTSIPNFYINAFYESKFKDSLFVIKAGGKIIEDETALNTLISNINELTHIGVKVVLIYGGGRAIDEVAEERGVEVKKTGGKRITDAANMQIVREVLGGDLSFRVSSAMAKEKLEGLSLNLLPPSWMEVTLKPKAPSDDFTGGIGAIDARSIKRQLKTTQFIACACLAMTSDGVVCNINADTIATQIAIAMKAPKLIFLSDVDGVKIQDQIVSLMTAEDIPAHIESGEVQGGMQVKLENCAEALKQGVRRIHLINGFHDDALKHEIFEPVGPGTMLILESEHESYMNEIEAQKVIEKRRA